MINIILSGGYGSRLWPLSRASSPKQFISLFNETTLYQDTVLRNREVCDSLITILGGDHYYLAKNQLEMLNYSRGSYLIEPVGRNTAPAIALGCLLAGPDEIVLVTPSDHQIVKHDAYCTAVREAEKFASQGFLVTFGLKPTFPETGFGYIEAKGNEVVAFREKPDVKTAESYVASGRHFWNSGMFCFRAGTFLDELGKYRPDILEASRAAFQEMKSRGAENISRSLMESIPKDSIDYAVLEKSSKVRVVPCDIGWADLGSFDSLYEENPADETGNVVLHKGDLWSYGSSGNLVALSKRTVALVDVEDMIIIDTPDALLVSRKGSSQKVKDVVTDLEKSKSPLIQNPMRVERPWGAYLVLEEKPSFKVKRIEVKPGARLSLQRHKMRSEHWTVVQGLARITLEQDLLVRHAGEFVIIPQGSAHRLENMGDELLIIVEVQMGTYLEEDDIERLEDDYIRFT